MRKDLLQSVLTKKSDFIKLIFAVFLLALGIGLIVNYLTILFESNIKVIIILGIILVSLVFIYLIINILSDCTRNISLKSVIMFEKGNVLPIERYDFSEKLSETLYAVFIENEALLQAWKEDFKSVIQDGNKQNPKIEKSSDSKSKKPIQYLSIIRMNSPIEERIETKSQKIVKEAVEYILLEKLSTHLSTYFSDIPDDDEMLIEYTRSDFPEILLKNRIINLLSTPFEDRPIFLKAKLKKEEIEGEIIAFGGSDGSRFSRFDLVLPKKSDVTRKDDGGLLITSTRLILEIDVTYDKFNTVAPRGFEELYIRKGSRDISLDMVDIEISVKIKPLSLLFNKGWKYYNWIDSFVSRIDKDFSFDSFIKRIDWENALTNFIITNNNKSFPYSNKTEN